MMAFKFHKPVNSPAQRLTAASDAKNSKRFIVFRRGELQVPL
jgi:hypothetical protein